MAASSARGKRKERQTFFFSMGGSEGRAKVWSVGAALAAKRKKEEEKEKEQRKRERKKGGGKSKEKEIK